MDISETKTSLCGMDYFLRSELERWGHRAETYFIFLLHLENVPSKNTVPVYTAASSREAGLWWALKGKSKACRLFPVLREWHHPLVSLPKTSLCWMDSESWLLSKPTESSLNVGFYIFLKWVGGQLALDLSLDGGKFELSYKGVFLFVFLFKKIKKERERHTWGFSPYI